MTDAAGAASAARRVRLEPLWVRVDRNRAKLATFVVAFIGGSATLLTAALVALPGWLLGWGADQIDLVSWSDWFNAYPWVVAGAFSLVLASGVLIAAVQLANAHDWVRNRFAGRPFGPDDDRRFVSAVEDMSIAAGLAAPPELMVLASGAVNAMAVGTTRSRPLIGVTEGFLAQLTEEEQRAVVATLIARICAGDILFGTALAALMGPIRAIRESRKGAKAVAAGTGGCLADGCTSGCGDVGGCLDVGDGCSGCADLGDDGLAGCAGGIVIVVFVAAVAALTYAAVVAAAWIVTLWGRALHRTSYEKADAEGMLLLKDPAPMLSALDKIVRATTGVGDGDPSYDGIFYAPTSGTTRVEPDERRRFERLREVLGTEGLARTLGAPTLEQAPAESADSQSE
ncbi:MAG: M48 family metalloprotease [Coriobacteriia bacterium]|nr:M48 family metalloprotease [Coriobacteriia bacterium]